MNLRIFTICVVVALSSFGCAATLKTINSTLGGLGGDPNNGPAHELKWKTKSCTDKKAKYYQDANGLRPNMPSSIGKGRPELVKIFGIDKEAVGTAAHPWSTSCTDDRNKKEWTRDKKGAEAYFKAFKEMAREQLRLQARDYAFFLGVNWQNKGNSVGLKAIEGNRAIRLEQFGAKKQLSKLSEKLKAYDACPHAPAGYSAELIKMAEAAYAAEFENINKFLDARLLENIKGQKMGKELKLVKKRDKRDYKKMIPGVIHYDWGKDVKIKAIRFVDGWHTVNKKVWNNNVLTHIYEDYTRIHVYLDLGKDRPYYKCAAIEGIKNRLAKGRKSIKGARNYGYCESVPK